MISIIMRLFLSEIKVIYKSLLQLRKVQSVEICLCSLSYGIAYDINTQSEIVSELGCEEVVSLLSLICEVVVKLTNFGGLPLIAPSDNGSSHDFYFAAMVQHSSLWFRLISLVKRQVTTTVALWLMYSKKFAGFKSSIAYAVLVLFTVAERFIKPNLTHILGDVLYADIQEDAFTSVCKIMIPTMLYAHGNGEFAREWTAFDIGYKVLMQSHHDYEFNDKSKTITLILLGVDHSLVFSMAHYRDHLKFIVF